MVHSCDQFRANAEKAAGLGRCAGRLGALNAGRLGYSEYAFDGSGLSLASQVCQIAGIILYYAIIPKRIICFVLPFCTRCKVRNGQVGPTEGDCTTQKDLNGLGSCFFLQLYFVMRILNRRFIIRP